MVERYLTDSNVVGSGRALFVTHNLNNFRSVGEILWRAYNKDSQLPILNSRSLLSNYEIRSDMCDWVCREHYNMVNSNLQLTRSELQVSIQITEE